MIPNNSTLYFSLVFGEADKDRSHNAMQSLSIAINMGNNVEILNMFTGDKLNPLLIFSFGSTIRNSCFR